MFSLYFLIIRALFSGGILANNTIYLVKKGGGFKVRNELSTAIGRD